MYYFELSSAKIHVIGNENVAAENPTFSLDGSTLVYFQRPADGPHQAVMECVKVRMVNIWFLTFTAEFTRLTDDYF
ncbi:hypothetical protein COOONC_05445 [Cooperia oncophora]